MALLDLDDTEQPMDPMLVMAIEAAFQRVSLTPVEFVPAPRVWRKSNLNGGPANGPKGPRKAQIKIELAKRDGFQCAYCARGFVDLDDATLDHVIPNSIIGHWQPWNLLLACEACNNAKADLVPLVLVPLLFSLLRDLVPLVQYTREVRRAEAKAAGRPSLSAQRKQYKRTREVRKAIERMGGNPYRRALEAAPVRAALPAGQGGE